MKILVLVWFDDESVAMMKCLCDYVRSLRHEIKLFGIHDHPNNTVADLRNELFYFEPTVCIIWNRHFPIDAIRLVKQIYPSCINKLFNWDPPICAIKGELDNVILQINEAYTCDKETSSLYPDWHYLLPFYDPELHYPDFDLSYSCDVSLVISNLYTNFYGRQKINRNDLIAALYNCQDIKFHLYGPERIGTKYKRAYKGFVPYETNRKVFSSSKICLNPHGDSSDSYLNERNITISASGGLMLVDNSKGIYEELQGACILMKDTIPEIISQIREILLNYDRYIHLRIKAMQVAQKYQVNNWVHTILN